MPAAMETASSSTPFPVKPSDTTSNGPTAALPPQMESVRSHTADEIVQMMNKTPLFMTSLENAGDEENIELEAIRALQYEGTPLENAQSFKEQGNEMVKSKRWADGKEFYNKAIAILYRSKLDRKKREESRDDEDDEGTVVQEQELEAICFVNQALCNLELKNYRSTTLDCASALRLNPTNVKAYYRSSCALLALDKVAEAADSCFRGIEIDPDNAPLKTLANRISDRQEQIAAIQRTKQQKVDHERKVKLTLSAALKARNIRTRITAQPPEMEDASIHLAPDPTSPTSALHFPTVLLYPLHAQSDFIKAFAETDTVRSHLEYIFPLPWDTQHEYTIDSVDIYMETVKGGLIKIGKNMSLLKALSSGEMEVVDGVVRINIVPREKAQMWIAEMKARQGKS